MIHAIWNVRKDEDRARWTFTPLFSVGPLRFGMSPGEVAAALDQVDRVSAASCSVASSLQRFDDVGVTAYYEDGARLAGVAIHALSGPQVTLGREALVARVPSVLEAWICDHTRAYKLDLMYSHEGNPGSADLGLLLRVQRAGDIVLTRPLFLTREWAMAAWDHLPQSEWSTF
ncbi:hypothetical protein AB0L05_16865 [Nonomuraea pusilla]|uniref:hypothetical protein n=1 Tax=Nonomuraea pusilla TaxID=46177 RepID=UPI0033306947